MPDARDLISIRSAGLCAEIDTMGAELCALQDSQGRALLWDGDPAVWAGRAPILFPIVGMLAEGCYRWGGRSYALPKHGLARHRRFQLVQADASSAVLRLGWDPETLAAYPFHFQLDVGFTLREASLLMVATVRNLDEREALLASVGFHPAFRWPLPYGEARQSHRLVFDQAEPAPIRRIDADGLLRPTGLPTPVRGRELALKDELFVDDALIFDQLRSRALCYGAAEGPQLEIGFAQASRLGVWTKPGAGYICVEPWRGVADPEGFAGDFSAKPGIFAVPPLAQESLAMSVTLRA